MHSHCQQEEVYWLWNDTSQNDELSWVNELTVCLCVTVSEAPAAAPEDVPQLCVSTDEEVHVERSSSDNSDISLGLVSTGWYCDSFRMSHTSTDAVRCSVKSVSVQQMFKASKEFLNSVLSLCKTLCSSPCVCLASLWLLHPLPTVQRHAHWKPVQEAKTPNAKLTVRIRQYVNYVMLT